MENAGVWIPAAANDSKKVGGSAEVTHLSLKAGSTAAHVAVYDANALSEATPNTLKWILDASTTDVDNERFTGLVFEKGIFMVLEQGDASTRVCYATRKYGPTTS